MNNQELSNKYDDAIKTNSLEKGVLVKKLEQHARFAKEVAQKILLGDDGKVGEAVIMSFFASLYGDIAKAYHAYKENRIKQEIDALDGKIKDDTNKIKSIAEAQEAVQKINNFTTLNIQKSALEQKLGDETLSQSAHGDAEKGLNGLVAKIDKIADFFEKSTGTLTSDIEKVEKDWYGDNAQLLQALRSLSPEIKDKLLKYISLDDIIDNDSLTGNIAATLTKSIIDGDIAETMTELSERAVKSATQELKD